MSKIKLTDSCNITTGKLDSNAFEPNGLYPFFTCSPEPLKINEYAFDDDVILLAGNNASGNFHCNRFTGKFNAYQRTYVITAKEGYDIDYIFYNLKINLAHLKKIAQGSQTKFLTMKILDGFTVEDIGIGEQIQLSRILKSIDDKISTNNRINSELESMAKTIYDYWFTQFDFPDENGKPYRSSGGKMVWNDELKREIPEGWEVFNVGGFCNIFTGKKDVNQSLESGIYKFYSCAPEYRYSNNMLYEGEAILISGNGSYTGRTIFINDAFDLYQRTYACVNKTDKDILLYIYYSMKRFFVPKVSGGTHGSAIPYIVYDDIAKEKIAVNYNVLSAYNKIIKPIQNKILKNERENQQLASLRDWLLPMLMNGQVGFEEGT